MTGRGLAGTAVDCLRTRCPVRKLKPEWLIACAVFCLFCGVSRVYTGPTYLSDEIGYLGHAALLARYTLDASTSWHAGYSLLLAPLFRIFSDPWQIWQAVMVLNAVLWAASSLVLTRLVGRFFPDRAAPQRIIAVVVAMLYPTWLAMSGYAFSTALIVLVFLLSMLAALSIDLRRAWSVVPHALAAGFLYWVHPASLAVAVASILALAVFSFRKRRFVPLAVHISLAGLMIGVYQIGVHEWLRAAGTPGAFPSLEHYRPLGEILPYLVTSGFWIKTVVASLGQASYLIIGSLGLAALGFVRCVQLTRDRSLCEAPDSPQRSDAISYASLFAVLSMVGVILLGAAQHSVGTGQMRIDHWIYGRYAEGVLMPFLAFGFLIWWRRRWLLLLAAGLVVCGTLLHVTAVNPRLFHNIVNVNSFWPQYLITEAPSYLVWMAVGASGVIAFQVARQMGRAGKIAALVLLACACVLSGVNAARFHRDLFSEASEPTGLVDIVRTNFQPGSCVGFNPEMPAGASLYQRERFKVHVFYLYDHAFRRVSVSEWLAGCDGFLFTYDIDRLQDVPGIVLLGQERRSSLYLVAKSRDKPFEIPDEAARRGGFYVAEEWSIRYELQFYGKDLASLPSPVGKFRNGSLVSTGQTGSLVFGPYLHMNAGEFILTVKGAASAISSARVDVVSSGATVQYARFALAPTVGDEMDILASGRLSLDRNVTDIQVRVYVGAEDEVRLDGYSLVPVDVTRDTLQVSHFDREDTPSHVGELRDSSLSSTGRSGLLVSGPCVPMNAGHYKLVVRGTASSTASAWVAVVSGQDSVEHWRFSLNPMNEGETGVLASGRLSLDEDVPDLEVRVYVGTQDEVRLDSYELARIDAVLASDFERWDYRSEVGELRDGSLASTGLPGFLVSGPHVPMKAGDYNFVVRGAAPSISSAWVDVVSDWGRVQHARFTLTPTAEGETGVLASGRVSLDKRVANLEVRVYVGGDDQVRLDDYELVRIDVTRDMLQVSHFDREDTPSRVGELRDGSLASIGRPGFLVLGPCVPMNAGDYNLVVRGAASSTASAWVAVVSGQDRVEHARFPLTPTADGQPGVLASGRLSLDEDVLDLEVRVYVGAEDEVRLDSYGLARIDVELVSHFERGDTPSEVGELRDGSLVSTGRPGFLVFGPYVPMRAGEYRLVVRGAAPSISSAWVDVVSDWGNMQHARFTLTPTAEGEPGVLASGRFSLDKGVANLEVRVYVGGDDQVRLDGYQLVSVYVTRDTLQVSHFDRGDTPSQVGELRDGSLVSTGRPGFLVLGPCVPMNASDYNLVVRGAASSTASAWVAVVSGQDRVEHARFPLVPTAGRETGVLASGRLSLDEDVLDLEVHVYVGAEDEVRLGSYELVRINVALAGDFERWGIRSDVGEFHDGSLVSTGRAGFLVFGPHVPMNAGDYNLVVTGAASSTISAWVEVTSDSGNVQHAKFALTPTAEGETGVLASGRVSLDEEVVSFEVRVYVGAEDEVRLDGYELVRIDAATVHSGAK